MPFSSVLNQLLKDIPDAKGVIILDWEGEAVAQATHISEYDLKVLGAHYGIIVQRLKEMLLQSHAGRFEEIIFHYKFEKTVVASLSEEYFLLVHLNGDSPTAMAVNKIRLCVADLEQEFIFD